MIRAAAAPDRFLTRGYARFISRSQAVHPRAPARAYSGSSTLARRLARRPLRNDPAAAFGIELPLDLLQLLLLTDGRTLGDFVPRPGRAGRAAGGETFAALLAAAGRADRAGSARARLCALLAGTVPFGSTRGGELWLYVLGEATSPARGVIAILDPAVPGAPRLTFRGASSFAFACALDESAAAGEDASRVTELRTQLAAPGVAEQEGVRASFERATALIDLLDASDAAVRRAAKKLASRSFEPPHPPRARGRSRARSASAASSASSTRLVRTKESRTDRTTPLALGALVEAFFRKETDEALAIVMAQHKSGDRLVREVAALLEDALATAKRPRTALARELARRRQLALRAARAVARPAARSSADRARLTRRLVELVDATKPAAEPLASTEPREEALLALAELGDRSAVPALVARAVTGDAGAVEMLAALGDIRAVAPLASLLRREPKGASEPAPRAGVKNRVLEAAVARALASLAAKSAAPALRELLAQNPMPSWREGIERGVLVKELVVALGALRDEEAGPPLQAVLESTSQEYRAILPIAAWALGRSHHLPALGTLERLLSSPKEPATCEAIWAVGEIGAAHPGARARAGALLDGLGGIEPGAEMVRLTALGKVRARTAEAPRASELRRALERALWEPAFRQEESSRRRTWAFRSLEELSTTRAPKRRSHADDDDPYFLGHDAVRYFVTRDDHRVRRAAHEAFAAWGVTVPTTRRYYAFLLDELEALGGLDALHEALRDPLGVFRHNIATRLAERAQASSVRPLAEATARLFAEPPTSTYEYDDAPSHLVAFVRALAKLNRPEGNDVLIDGLRTGNHQVRAVVAENAPDDERFVPELMAMLGDPRSFLRSRAERSLAALGVSPRGSDRPTSLLEV